MNPVERLIKLAARLERKISLAQGGMGVPLEVPVSQPFEAPDFFFGTGYDLKNFQDSLGNLTVTDDKVVGDRSLARLMADFWNKTNQSISVVISIEVVAGKYARWVTQITPHSFVQPALAELNRQYQAITGRTWDQGQADADKRAKQAKNIVGDFKRVIVNKGI